VTVFYDDNEEEQHPIKTSIYGLTWRYEESTSSSSSSSASSSSSSSTSSSSTSQSSSSLKKITKRIDPFPNIPLKEVLIKSTWSIGDRVRVFWNGEDRYYWGTLLQHDVLLNKWLVKYDDQTRQWEPIVDLLDADEVPSLLRQLEIVMISSGYNEQNGFHLSDWKMQYTPRAVHEFSTTSELLSSSSCSSSSSSSSFLSYSEGGYYCDGLHEFMIVSPSGMLFRSPREVLWMYNENQQEKLLYKEIVDEDEEEEKNDYDMEEEVNQDEMFTELGGAASTTRLFQSWWQDYSERENLKTI